MKIKVCGMREKNNILDVVGQEPDYMGFIFYDRSPRFVGLDFRIPVIPAHVKRVGVFVNDTTEAVLEKVNAYGLDYVQLHGDEPVAQCKALNKNNVKVIKVFSVDEQFDFEKTKPYAEFSEYFLFDTKGKYYGGNAKRFNWKMLQQYDQKLPFLLSGGIGPDNIADVKELAGMNIHAIDLNSGVEVRPGIKDPAKIMETKRILNSK